ncbi:YesK-like family protein [Oceanobacillus jeddahense]|uniref:YesK-like family protein n=1 Tax=Oceanobacillus jeddahense TaxID=1462527 RepID=A0ABY5JXD1_9BACI|nr:YesK-like family protein [Oceanobacillus jeddahense]UUI03502.1 YesK-like family protein [Oceanobacillus jeddahense]
MFRIIGIGIFFGVIVFLFTFIASKKSGKYYMAPVVTFLIFLAVVAYSLVIVGGFEGMGVGFLGAGFLVVSIVGTLFLPLLTRWKFAREFTRKDIWALILLPLLFFSAIGAGIYLEDNYWVIDEGETTVIEGEESYYEVTTISEGRKQVTVHLGEEYAGKNVEVEKVNKRGPTEVTVKIVDGGSGDKSGYIMIGLDQITEPVTVQTTDGDVIEPSMEQEEN